MIPICSAKSLRDNDLKTSSEDGLPGIALMEHAGAEVARYATQLCQHLTLPRIRIFCGPGQNGGDGFVAARHLLHLTPQVSVFCTRPYHEYKNDAQIQLEVLRQCGIDPVVLTSEIVPTLSRGQDLEIDALLGTGATGAPRGVVADLIHWINRGETTVLSIDAPSGMIADDGQTQTQSIQNAHCLSIGALKACQIFEPAASQSTLTKWTPLGFPQHRGRRSPFQRLEDRDAASWIPHRSQHGHKGTSGKLLIWAGSPSMMGAAILATKSALKTGVGMVKILLPQGQSPVLLQHCPEAMAVEWPMTTDEASQHLGAEVQFQNHEVTVQRLTELSTWADAVLVGPGLGLDDATMSVFQQWLPHCHTPCLLDADALSLLAKCMGQHNEPEVTHNASPLHDSKTWLKPQHLLTPHRGEAKRLWGVAPEPSMDWIAFCQSIAKQHGVQIHFKGAPSLTAWSNGDIVVNNSGSSILSTAGSGDVLSGMAASLMAQGCIAQIAGSLGAYLHGRCADRCSQKGEFGHTAMDLCEHIGAVMSNPFQPES